jgi:hypothetical protein
MKVHKRLIGYRFVELNSVLNAVECFVKVQLSELWTCE